MVPAQLVKALAQAARRAGAFIYDHTEVIALERSESGDSIKGAWTSRGELLRCDQFVIAAGTWSAKLGEWLSVPLPIRPVRGEIVALQQPPASLRTIIFDEGVWDEDIYIAPKPDGTVIIGATKAYVGFDTSVSAGGVQHLLDVAIRLLPALANCPIARMWACLRPKTPDSRPLLGPLPGWSNVTVASGHGGFGVTLSIVTGETIAELVATGQYPEIIRPFAPQGQRSTRSNELSEKESAALPFHHPAFSEQQVKDFAIRWAIKQFSVAPADQARVRVGYNNDLLIFGPFVLFMPVFPLKGSLPLRRASFDETTCACASSLVSSCAWHSFLASFSPHFFVGTGRWYSNDGEDRARSSWQCPKLLIWCWMDGNRTTVARSSNSRPTSASCCSSLLTTNMLYKRHEAV